MRNQELLHHPITNRHFMPQSTFCDLTRLRLDRSFEIINMSAPAVTTQARRAFMHAGVPKRLLDRIMPAPPTGKEHTFLGKLKGGEHITDRVRELAENIYAEDYKLLSKWSQSSTISQ